MENNLDLTMKFELKQDDKLSISETISIVLDALNEKGYNPANQIIGYLLSGDSSYITCHKNARSLIKKFDRDEIIEELLLSYTKGQNKR